MSFSLSSDSCASSSKEGCSILPNLRFLADDIAEIFTGDKQGTVEVIEMKNYVIPNVSAPPYCVFKCTEENSDEYVTCVEFPGNAPYLLTGTNRGELFVFRERLNCPHPFVEKRRIYRSPENIPFFMIRSNQLDAGFVCAAYAESSERDRLVVLDLLRQEHMEKSVPLVDFVTKEEIIDATWTWKHPSLLALSTSDALRLIDVRCSRDCPRSLFFRGPANMLRPSHFRPEVLSALVGSEIQLFDIRKLAGPMASFPIAPELTGCPIDSIKWHPRLPHQLLYSSTTVPFIARLDTDDCETIHVVKVKNDLPKKEIMSWDRTWDFAETDQSFVDMVLKRRNETYPIVEGRTVIPGYGEQYDICRQDDTQEMPLIMNPMRDYSESDCCESKASSSNNSLQLGNFSGIEDDIPAFPGDCRDDPHKPKSVEKGDPNIKEVKIYSFVTGAGINAKSNSSEMKRRASLQSVFSEAIPIQPNKYYQKYQQISENAVVFETVVVNSQTEEDPVVYETTDRTASPVISNSMNPTRLLDNSSEVKALREEKKRCIYWDPQKALRSLSVLDEVMEEATRELNSILPSGTSISVEAVNSLATMAINKLRAVYKNRSVLTGVPSTMGFDSVNGFTLKTLPKAFAIPGYGLSGIAFLHWGPTSRIQFIESIISENEENTPVEFIFTIEEMRLHELYKITRPGLFNLFADRLGRKNTHPKKMGRIETLLYMQGREKDPDPWFLLWAIGSAHYYEAPIRNAPLLKLLRKSSTRPKKPRVPSLRHFLEKLPPPKPRPPPRPMFTEGIDASLSIEHAVKLMDLAEKEKERLEKEELEKMEAIKTAALNAQALSVTGSCSSSKQSIPSTLKSSMSKSNTSTDRPEKKCRKVSFASTPPVEWDPNPMPLFYRIKTNRDKPLKIDSDEKLPLKIALKAVPTRRGPRKPKKKERKKYTLKKNRLYRKERRLHKSIDMQFKGFPGLLQLVDMDISKDATKLAYFDSSCMKHVTFYTSPYRVRMLIPFRLAGSDRITRKLRPDADSVHDYLEVMFCSLVQGKFSIFVQVLEEIGMTFAVPNTIGKVYSRHAQFFLDLVKLFRVFVEFVTMIRPKATTDSVEYYDLSDPLIKRIDAFVAKEHELLHKEYILVLPCLMIIRMELECKEHLESLKDKIVIMKRLPFHFRLLFLVRTCTTEVLRSCLLKMYHRTKGIDRLIYVGLGRHNDCLTVLADHLHDTQDYQMITHLLVAGRVLEEDDYWLEVVSELVRDKPKMVKIPPPPKPEKPPQPAPMVYAKKKATNQPPQPQEPKQPLFEEVHDSLPPMQPWMFAKHPRVRKAQEDLFKKYMTNKDGRYQIYKFLKSKGRLPPHLHMYEVFENKYVAGIVPGSTLIAIARLAMHRYFVYLTLVDGLVQESDPLMIDSNDDIPDRFMNGGLFKYYLAKLSGTCSHDILFPDEVFSEIRCQFCGATRNTAVRPVPEEEQQQQINKRMVLKDRADRRRNAMAGAAAEMNKDGKIPGDPDSFVPHEDINGSMATTEIEKGTPPPSACPQCRKPSGRCIICQRIDRTEFSDKSDVDHVSMHFVICKICHHGGHMEHIQSWFRRYNECAVNGCCCKCYRLPMGEGIRMWIEEDMGFHPDATFEF